MTQQHAPLTGRKPRALAKVKLPALTLHQTVILANMARREKEALTQTLGDRLLHPTAHTHFKERRDQLALIQAALDTAIDEWEA